MNAPRAVAPAALVAALLTAAPARSRAEDDDGRARSAIQLRKFRMDHEIAIAAAFLPLDYFTKAVAVEAAYTLHLTDWLGFEVVRGFYAHNLPDKLRVQLEQDFKVPASQFETVQFGASSALVFAPAYGKLAFSEVTAVHAEVFLVGGAMAAMTTTLAVKIGPSFGIGFRVFVSESLSVRVDARYTLLLAARPTPLVTLSLGFCLDFGSAD